MIKLFSYRPAQCNILHDLLFIDKHQSIIIYIHRNVNCNTCLMAFYYTSQTLESHLLRKQTKIEHHLKISLKLFSAKY
jgi:hypothetical protein